jgi:hypothetical protein
MIYVNPDDFLGNPRIFTEERNREAWRACKDLVERTLTEASERYNYYFICGVQGSGKTRWVKENRAWFVEPAIVFDAALSRARDRAGGCSASASLFLPSNLYLDILSARRCPDARSRQAS